MADKTIGGYVDHRDARPQQPPPSSPRYNEFDQPVCRVCDVILKSESLWDAHQASRKHHEAIKNVKANAAGLTRANNAKPEAPKPESSTVLSNATSEPSMNLQKAQLSSGLPADFFDNHVTKKQKSGKKKTDIQLKLFFISSILGYGNNYLRLSMSTLTTPVKPQSW
eukprot:XP_010655175.1 PREDICTED: zinc finger protein 830-like [Vitis vinifera]